MNRRGTMSRLAMWAFLVPVVAWQATLSAQEWAPAPEFSSGEPSRPGPAAPRPAGPSAITPTWAQLEEVPPADPLPAMGDWNSMTERLEAAERRIRDLEQTDVEGFYIDDEGLQTLQRELAEEEDPGVSVNVTGQLQLDYFNFSQSDANRATIGELENASGFRRARLGAFGEVYETTEYRVEFDFAGNGRPRFLDNWIAVKNVPFFQNVIVGHFFEPFSLERYTPNRFITFMERSLADTFAPARNTGIMIFDHSSEEPRYTWALGAFANDSNTYGESMSDSADWAGTGHVTWLPYFDDESDGRRLLHLGASYSYRAVGDKVVRYNSRAEYGTQLFDDFGSPQFVDTGNISADRVQLFGLEAAWVHGPLSIQAESIHSKVERLDGPNPVFWAGYVYGSYFLTGENRSYSPGSILGRFREGIFQRITPNTNAFASPSIRDILTGSGAWEIGARLSHIDLNRHDIAGNRLTDLTIGLNWYLNAHTRIQWNYVRPNLFNNAIGESTADVYMMRFAFEF